MALKRSSVRFRLAPPLIGIFQRLVARSARYDGVKRLARIGYQIDTQDRTVKSAGAQASVNPNADRPMNSTDNFTPTDLSSMFGVTPWGEYDVATRRSELRKPGSLPRCTTR